MDSQRIKKHCPNAISLGRGTLYGYELQFSLWDDAWGGGVASIVESDNGIIEGVLYVLPLKDIETLDEHEDVSKGDYNKKFVQAINSNQETVIVFTYVSPDNIKRFIRPKGSYLETMIRGAVEHGLSRKYIENLRNLNKKNIK